MRFALAGMAAWLLLLGTVVLVSRAAVGVAREPMLWGFAGLVPVLIGAMAMARRRVPEAASVRALLDRHGRAGGLIMAANETPLGEWGARTPQVRGPRVEWRSGRAWTLLWCAMAFAAVSFAVPQRLMTIHAPRPLDIGDQADKIAEQIDTLKEEKVIDEKRADELTEKLEQVKAEASADDPVKTWESLDHLKDTLEKAAQQAAEQGVAQTQKMAQAQALAEAVAADQQSPQPMLDAQLAAAAMSELSQTLKQLADQNQQFKEALNKEKADPSKMTPDEAKQMKQVFLSDKLDQATLDKIRDAMEKLGLSPKHMSEVDENRLKEIRDALTDNKIDKAEREKLKKELADMEMAKSELGPISDEQLQTLEQALKDMGLKEDQFALIPNDQAQRLTSEELKQLQELMQAAANGKKYRQIYLREGIDPATVLKVHLALMRVQFEAEHTTMAERAGAKLMWQLATRQIDEAALKGGEGLIDPEGLAPAVESLTDQLPQIAEQAKAAGVVSDEQLADVKKLLGGKLPSANQIGAALSQVDPAMMKAAMGEAAKQMSNAGGFSRHVGIVDSQAIELIWRLLADDWLEDDEMQILEAKLESHQLEANQLPTLNDETLGLIDSAMRDLHLTEDDYALLPPPRQLTPEELKQLLASAGACQNGKLGLSNRMGRLVKVKLVDPKMLSKMGEAGQCDSKGLAAFLAENAGSSSMSSMMSAWGMPGQGGISRGRGDAPLTWKDPASESGAKFTQQELPEADMDALKKSQMVGVSLGAPQLVDAKPVTASGALSGTDAGGGSAVKQTVLPKHRAAVQAYFQRE
ncbi:MAG: hypothetical protein GC162_18185 [Planctomycetes bacterium]|nr:hypothetical protein [Planctomycetota bacterium]